MSRVEDGRELAGAAVAIAASAGGLDAVTTVLTAFPATLPAAVLIVQHLDPHHPSLMAEILDRRTSMRVKQAQTGESLVDGTAYVAPPDQHLLVTRDRLVELTRTQPVHFLRPSADLLFASVAEVFGAAAVAVILTGGGSDGADGAREVKQRGGHVLVEDPATARFSSMPDAAVATGVADSVLPVVELGPAVANLLSGVVRLG